MSIRIICCTSRASLAAFAIGATRRMAGLEELPDSGGREAAPRRDFVVLPARVDGIYDQRVSLVQTGQDGRPVLLDPTSEDGKSDRVTSKSPAHAASPFDSVPRRMKSAHIGPRPARACRRRFRSASGVSNFCGPVSNPMLKLSRIRAWS
jgi:hypothetical protein